MAKKNPSSPAGNPNSQRWVRAALIALAVLPFVVFPPVRLRSKNASGATTQAETFNAKNFAARLWVEKLLPGLATSVDVRTLHAALDTSVADAAKKYARTVGIGGTAYFCVTGEGTVTAVDEDGFTVSFGENEKFVLSIDTGLVFGNAVRDGTGLLDVNTFANSEEFNAIAAELNTIVENEVLPAARKLGAVGAKIRFAGIAELTGTDSDPRPLRLTPLKVEALP